MKEHKKDIICGVVFAVIGILIRVFRESLIVGKFKESPYGPNAFPTLIAYGMILCGILLAITSYGKLKAERKAAMEAGTYRTEDEALTKPAEYLKQEWTVLAFMAISAAYVFLLRKAGYFIVSFGAMTLLLLMLKARKKSYYIAVYATILIVYFGFYFGLNVRLPLGSWFGY